MNKKNGLSRITIDMEPQEQRRLKVMAAQTGISIRQIVLQSIASYVKKVEESDMNKQFEGLNK